MRMSATSKSRLRGVRVSRLGGKQSPLLDRSPLLEPRTPQHVQASSLIPLFSIVRKLVARCCDAGSGRRGRRGHGPRVEAFASTLRSPWCQSPESSRGSHAFAALVTLIHSRASCIRTNIKMWHINKHLKEIKDKCKELVIWILWLLGSLYYVF